MRLLLETALELGLISSLTVLALFISYTMLGVCDLSTDGCFTLGACVGAVVALSGHPYLSILAAMLSGMLSGLVTSLLQTYFGINSLLSGIIVNTGLYSINIAIMGGASLLNLNKTITVFTTVKDLLKESVLSSYYSLIIILFFVILTVIFIGIFFRTRLGLAIRATGDNIRMVRSSSIDPYKMTVIALCMSNSLTALSGCLLAQCQRSVNIDLGSGMVTVALASLLIGRAFVKRGSISKKATGAVLGALVFRLVYTVALRLNMPAFMLKLISAIIVILAIAGPYLKERYPLYKRRRDYKRQLKC